MVEKTDREKAQSNIAENRKAFHDYHLLETFEAGVVLLGTEVKAIREGRVNLRDSFARLEDGEVYLFNVNISPYSHRGYADHEPLRRRKLLLHRDEIRKLVGKTVEKGMTLVPVRLYYKNGRVKVAVSLAKGKKDYDKRETIKRRETDRETRAAIKSRRPEKNHMHAAQGPVARSRRAVPAASRRDPRRHHARLRQPAVHHGARDRGARNRAEPPPWRAARDRRVFGDRCPAARADGAGDSRGRR